MSEVSVVMLSVAARQPIEAVRKEAARLVRERREELGVSQDLQLHGGPSRTAVWRLENHLVWPGAPTLRKLAAALKWPADAFERIERGESPEEANDEQRRQEVWKLAEELKAAIDRLTEEALRRQ